MSDQLKLTATLDDQTRVKLAEMQKNLKAIPDAVASGAEESAKRSGKAFDSFEKAGKKAHAEVARAAREHARSYHELTAQIDKAAGGSYGFLGDLASRFGAVGSAAAVAAYAILKIKDAVDNVADRGVALGDLARQANMTAAAFGNLENAMTKMHASRAGADTSLAAYGQLMTQARAGSAEARSQMSGMGVNDYNRFTAPMLGLNNADAFKKLVEAVTNASDLDIAKKIKVYTERGIDPDTARELAVRTKEEANRALKEGRSIYPADAIGNAESHQKGKEYLDELVEREKNKAAANAFGTPGFISRLPALGNELFNKDPMESKPWDAIMGWGKYDPKAAKEATKEGVVEGLKDYNDSLSTTAAGGYKPMAYHPGEGGGGGPGVRGGGYFGNKDFPAVDDPGNGTPGVGATRGHVAKGGDPRGMENYIRESAKKYGIDPDTAVAVAKSEGLGAYVGDNGTSFGAFQLHTGGGMGDDFKKATGLDPRDPKNEHAMVDYTMKNLGKTGWSPYHGARNAGIGPRAGIGAPGQGPTAANIRADGLRAFIMHHTGGRGTIASVQETLRPRGLGVEYVMDRDGNIQQTGNRGAANIMPGWGPKGAGLNNSNILGMEVIAKNDRDVTAAQIKSAKAFIAKNYPGLPVYGHGEVNPGHKEADEGMSIVNAIRAGRATPHGASLRDHIRHGRKPLIDGGLGQQSNAAGGRDTNHRLSVDFSNMPRGTRTAYSGDGLFKEVKLNRGRAMASASQDS